LSRIPALQARYNQALARRVHDPAQDVVMSRLAALEACLAASTRSNLLVRLVDRLRKDRRFRAQCRGIYLWGGVGRGKTWLMDLFFAGLPRLTARRLHFQHFMRELHRRLARQRGQLRPADRVAAQMARQARVYCIDEFQVQDIGDAMILHGVLQGMLQRGVVLVFTSNTAPEHLYAGGLQRERFLPTIALLAQQLDVIQIGNGVDYRLRAMESVPHYLLTTDPTTDRNLARLFASIAGPQDRTASQTLRIEDREIPVVRAAGGMAWFEFAALCEGPRSSRDYIAIADRLHSVFLANVPRFDGGNDDAARRFIALIDELYDRKVQLIVAAAAEPAKLYGGERLAADFARTASRLLEMGSPEYRARQRLPATSTR
jgi:cell division protein ZapE